MTTEIAPSSNSEPRADAAVDASRSVDSLMHRTFRGSVWVICGMAGGQLVRLLSNLVLTRALFPEAFGLMLIVHTVIMALELLSDVGIFASIINHRRGEDPAFLATAWTLQILRGISLWLIACLITGPIAWWYGYGELIYLIPVTSVSALLVGFQSTALPLLNRQVYVGRVVGLEFFSHLIGVSVMMVWVLICHYSGLKATIWILVAGTLVSSASKMFISHRVLPGHRDRIGWDPAAFVDLFRFGRWIVVSTAITFLLSKADVLILSGLLTQKRLGVYAIALYLATAMIDVMVRLSRHVLFPVYSRLAELGEQRLRQRTFTVRLAMLGVALPVLWFVILFSQQIIDLLYDDRYQEAGWMLQILAIGVIGMVISETASGVMLAVGNSWRYMIFQIARAMLLFAGLGAGWYFGEFFGLLAGMAAARVLEYPLLAWAIRPYNTWLPALDLSAYVASAAVVGTGWYLMA